MERTGPPGIVRTFSNQSSRSSRRQTPEIQAEARSYLDDAQSDDDVQDPEAIGVARTSNVPILAPPLPLVELPGEGNSSRYKQPDHQGFVELAPRKVATASVPTAAVKTPSPEQRSAPAEKSFHRKEVLPEKSLQRRLTPPKSRTPPLASLRESGSWVADPQETSTPRFQTREPQISGSSSSSPVLGRRAQVKGSVGSVSERSSRRNSTESSSRPVPDGVNFDKPTLQRVSSTTSTVRSVGTSILHPGRDSDSSINRSRGLSLRMSEEDRQREFDSLVKSRETVRFTLTPHSMREDDVGMILGVYGRR
jgi:hypothetical protein